MSNRRKFSAGAVVTTITAANTGLFEIATGANLQAEILEIHVGAAQSFTTNQQIDVALQKKSADGTGTAATETKYDPDGPAVTAVVLLDTTGGTWTTGDYGTWGFASLAGLHQVWQAGDGPILDVSETFGLRIVAAITSTSLSVSVVWREI